jgi:hypothetical protein
MYTADKRLPLKQYPLRLLGIFALLLIGLLVMIGRFFWLQIIDGPNLAHKAKLSTVVAMYSHKMPYFTIYLHTPPIFMVSPQKN